MHTTNQRYGFQAHRLFSYLVGTQGRARLAKKIRQSLHHRLIIIAQAKRRHRHALFFGNMSVSINAGVYNTWPYETSRPVEDSRTQLRPTGRAEWMATQKLALGFLGKHEKPTYEYKP